MVFVVQYTGEVKRVISLVDLLAAVAVICQVIWFEQELIDENKLKVVNYQVATCSCFENLLCTFITKITGCCCLLSSINKLFQAAMPLQYSRMHSGSMLFIHNKFSHSQEVTLTCEEIKAFYNDLLYCYRVKTNCFTLHCMLNRCMLNHQNGKWI